jgi:hypothetical protein
MEFAHWLKEEEKARNNKKDDAFSSVSTSLHAFLD